MDWLFEFDRTPHDVTVTTTGQALAAELGRLFEALCADGDGLTFLTPFGGERVVLGDASGSAASPTGS